MASFSMPLTLKIAELARNMAVCMKTGKTIVDSVFKQSLFNASSSTEVAYEDRLCCSVIDGKLQIRYAPAATKVT